VLPHLGDYIIRLKRGEGDFVKVWGNVRERRW